MPKRSWVKPLPHTPHQGAKVRIGQFEVMAGGLEYLKQEDFARADVLIPLLDKLPLQFGRRYEILAATLPDFGGVPPDWEEFLRQQVIPTLEEGKRILAFCFASHGRTGTFLASLIALLEPETADPIAAVRARHCECAIETRNQAKAIFALRGEGLPKRYEIEFTSRKPEPALP